MGSNHFITVRQRQSPKVSKRLWLGDNMLTDIRRRRVKTAVFRSPNFRLSLSLSLILLLHRILYRFFSRLRVNLLTKDAAPFRRRNPRISKSLTSHLTPAVGASLAGLALGVYPADQLRVTVAIYFATRAAEFTYNALENNGWFRRKPFWVGSWMLMPFATGQLLHAFVFDRDCFPKVILECNELTGFLLKPAGVWRLHPESHPELRSAKARFIPCKIIMAQPRYNSRLSRRDLPLEMAVWSSQNNC